MTPPPRDPSSSASHDDEYEALLQEIRVLLPGVEILFAFLLSIAFTQQAAELRGHLQWSYLLALGASAIASVLLTTPGVYHRMRWREAHKEDVLRRSNALAIAGTGFLSIAATAGLFVASAVIFDDLVAGIMAGILGAVTVVFWFLLPAVDRFRRGGGRRERSEPAPVKAVQG